MSERARLELALGCVAISFAAIFFRFAGGVDPLLASAIRLAIAAVVLAPSILRARDAGRIDRRFLRAAVLGGLLYAVHFGCWVASLSRTSVAASVTLVTASPIFLALVALARGKDRATPRQVGGIALAVVGALVISGHDWAMTRDALVGDALALVAAVAMAGYLLDARALGPELDAAAFNGTSALFGALFLAACVGPSAVDEVQWIDRETWLWLAAAAVIPQAIGHTMLTRALAAATPTVVGLATCSEPVLSTLLAIPLLGEMPAPVVVLGCAITLAGVLLGARA